MNDKGYKMEEVKKRTRVLRLRAGTKINLGIDIELTQEDVDNLALMDIGDRAGLSGVFEGLGDHTYGVLLHAFYGCLKAAREEHEAEELAKAKESARLFIEAADGPTLKELGVTRDEGQEVDYGDE